MKIGFIGAGKVGKALGRYFLEQGLDLSGYCDRYERSTAQAAADTNSKAYGMETVLDLIQASDVIMLTVQDTYIGELAETLSNLDLPPGKIYCHTSGALEAAVMAALRGSGGQLFSFHPLQAFSNVDQAVRALRETWFFVEGDLETLNGSNAMKALLQALPNPIRYIREPGKKAAYHAAAVVASNYLMVLLKFSQDLMVEAGVTAKDAQALRPLIDSALDNYQQLGPEVALSGPIVRGDVGTVAKHLEVLEGMESVKAMETVVTGTVGEGNTELPRVSWESVYKLLGMATLDLARAQQLKDEEKAQAISSLLDCRMEASHEK